MSAGAIVVDIGTSCSRIGTSGDAVPVFQSFREPPGTPVWESRTIDFELVGKVLTQSKLFDGSSQQTDVLIAESVLEIDPLHYRKRICELLFEEKDSRSVCFQYAPVLTCFANARQSALVVDLSAGGCTATAVLDGWCSSDKDKVERSGLGGEDLDTFLAKVENGPKLSKQAFNQLSAQRRNRESPEGFTLPDSTTISDRVCDLLFDPTPLDDPANYVPLHEMVFTAAMKQSPSAEIRRSLMNNIVVCGGLSRTEGLVSQLTEKLNILGKMQHPRVISCGLPQRHLTSWIGGSILASLAVFKELGVTRQEYLESGQDSLIKKFA